MLTVLAYYIKMFFHSKDIINVNQIFLIRCIFEYLVECLYLSFHGTFIALFSVDLLHSKGFTILCNFICFSVSAVSDKYCSKSAPPDYFIRLIDVFRAFVIYWGYFFDVGAGDLLSWLVFLVVFWHFKCNVIKVI